MIDTDNEENDLLGELAGETKARVTSTPIDPELTPKAKAKAKAERRDPLDVAPTLAANKAAADATAATAGLKGYAVTVRGEYLAAAKDAPGRKVKMPYTIIANVKTLEGALGTINRYLLEGLIKAKHPDFVSRYTSEIIDTKPLSKDMPESNNLQFMSLDRVHAFIKSEGVPINAKNYPADGVELRKALIDWKQNPKGFDQREKRRVDELLKKAELDALNPK